MALLNKENGQYLKINELNLIANQISLLIYENKEHRIKGVNEFHPAILEYIHIPDMSDILATMAVSSKTIRDNIISGCYENMKKRKEFENFENC